MFNYKAKILKKAPHLMQKNSGEESPDILDNLLYST